MRQVSLYDDLSLKSLLHLQLEKEWDLEHSIPWEKGVDLTKPFVPLDQEALFFPDSSKEERLVISQMMGVIIATSICEMEECLLRLKKIAWTNPINKHPVSPEFLAFGEQFFIEEQKHSTAFRRYLCEFAQKVNLDLHELRGILPLVEGTITERILRKNLEGGGCAFWWVVAEVEQEFLHLYHTLNPFKEKLDPLYFILHKKHFEEEARHAPFPYLMLELLMTREKNIKHSLHAKSDLVISQFLTTLWAGHSLLKMKSIRKFSKNSEFFMILSHALESLDHQPPWHWFWKFLTSTPYVSSLVNPKFHHRFMRFTEEHKIMSLPFPNPKPNVLVLEPC